MKESMKLCLFLTVAVLIISLVSREVTGYPMLETGPNNGPYASNIPSSQLQVNPDGNIQFSPGAPQITFDPRMRLYLLNWLQSVGYPTDRLRVKKTNCLINAGLSHACDNMDTLNTIHEGLYLGSSDTPGRK